MTFLIPDPLPVSNNRRSRQNSNMSSDRPTNSNDLHRLLSQYQQLFTSSSQRHQPATGLLPTLAAMAATSPPAVAQGQGLLLTNNQQQLIGDGARTNNTQLAASSWCDPENVSAYLSQVQLQHQHEALRPLSSTSDINVPPIDQHILPPPLFLSAFPGLNEASIAQALTLKRQQQVQQQQVQQRQRQHSQLNKLPIMLESLYQKLQEQASNPYYLPAESVCSPSKGSNLDISRSQLTSPRTTNQDASSIIKEATTLPISLHGLNSDMPSDDAAASRSTASPPVYLSARHWSLEELESHAKQLEDSNQDIPQSIAILLASSRRKQEKQNAKKLANRKSAVSSRARKKAKIDAMAEENTRLKREVSILSSIPDPVVAIGIDGVITFCSRQMERVVLHKTADLIGENIEKFIVPDSMVALEMMIEDVVTAKKQTTLEEGDDIARSSYVRSSDPPTLSKQSSNQSFPMPESSSHQLNKCENVERPVSPSGDNPKTHANKEDSNVKPSSEKGHQDQQLQYCRHQSSLLESRGSSLSLADSQEYSLSMTIDSSLGKAEYRPTANDLSEDSRDRESSDNQESNKSLLSSMYNIDKDYFYPPKEVKRTAPLAPACHVRLIRDDLSTIWCEITSSVITLKGKQVDRESTTNRPSEKNKVVESEIFEEETELLLCFRPIVEGETVREELRFIKRIDT